MEHLAKIASAPVENDEIKFYPLNTRIPIATGWRISKTGASAVNFGGDTVFLPISCPRADSW